MTKYYPLALKIATDAHRGQKRKRSDLDAITHPLAVADNFSNDYGKSVAILHDVLEDSDKWTAQDLLNAGLPPQIIKGAQMLTRLEDGTQTYFDYIMSLINFDYIKAELTLEEYIDILKVKLEDHNHNLLTKKPDSPKADIYRFSRYIIIQKLDKLFKERQKKEIFAYEIYN